MQTVQTPRVSAGTCRRVLGLVVLPLALASGCQTAEGTGALVGGGTGALLGNAVGKAAGGSGARTAGTLIGGGLGAIAGAATGSSLDRANNRAARAEAKADAATAAAAAQQSYLGLTEVADLARQGVTDQVIINQIHTTGSTYQLSGQDIVWLKQSLVSDRVISAMQATSARAPRRVYTATPVPVYVAEPPPPRVGVGYHFHGH